MQLVGDEQTSDVADSQGGVRCHSRAKYVRVPLKTIDVNPINGEAWAHEFQNQQLRSHRLLLFDEFWIPRRTVIATAQGLKKLKATQGPLADLKVLNSPHAAVDALWEGHLLRWLKQVILGGLGRCFDERGICGPQKLVCSADKTRLLSNFDRLFPGASIEVVTATATTKQSYTDALLDILSRPGLPNVLSTKWIGQQMHTPWRNISKHVLILEDVQRAITNLGWRYVSRKGRLG